MTAIMILVFPIVFMIHEFEEIIGLKPWFARNGVSLAAKFPTLRKQILRMTSLSTEAFAVAVCEEFLIVSIVTISAVYWEWYYAWMAILLAFTLHLLVHIVQWIIVRKYIPMIVTSLMCLPYCGYAIRHIAHQFSYTEIIMCLLCGTFFMILNLFAAHKLSALFDRRTYETK